MAKTKSKSAEAAVEAEVISDSATDQVVTSWPEGATPSEFFPERRPTDVDVAEVKAKSYKGEHTAPLNAETFVILDGSHDDVPDDFDGKVAAVLNYPTAHAQDPDTGEEYEYLPPKGEFTVRELSQGAMLYSLPVEAFKSIHTNGRPEVLGIA